MMQWSHEHFAIRKLNSWRLGSTVRVYSEPRSLEELIKCYQLYRSMRTIWLGLGSNVLLPDHELDAHIIKLGKAMSSIEYVDGYMRVSAAVPLAKLARNAAKNGYLQAAFLCGIPGTLGGALYMNAGACGSEIWDYVHRVLVLTVDGIEWLLPSDFNVSYRHVEQPIGVIAFLAAELYFESSSAVKAMSQIKTYLEQRNRVQPIGTFNCGSVFKNPEQNSAGRLIDALGLLGYQEGYARISPMHGNFIENVEGLASSRDIRSIMQLMQDEVLMAYNIKLETEVIIYD